MEHLVLFQLAVTGLLLLISLLEALVLQSRGPGAFDWSEAWLSIGDMIGRRLLALLPLSIATPVFAWAWSHRLFTIELNGVAEFLLLFVGLEFFYYWYHRTAHRVRFFWATLLSDKFVEFGLAVASVPAERNWAQSRSP